MVIRSVDDLLANARPSAEWVTMRSSLLDWLNTLDERLASDGMLWVIENSARYQHHLLAGELLSGRGVRLQVSPEEFVRRIAPRLNSSADSVVRYLKEQVGREAALEAVHAVRATDADPGLRARLDTLLYWLGEHPGPG